MSSQWLEMRIQEEQDRRRREARTLEKLPDALIEVYGELADCIGSYTAAFGPESAGIELADAKIRITVSESQQDQWQVRDTVEVLLVPELPGFHIERAGQPPLSIQVGLLPGDKLLYRQEDAYIVLEEVSRRILDRTLFPKLAE